MDLADLEAILRDRLENPPPESYAATLLADPERTQRKIMEEAFELCLELGRRPPDLPRVAEEAADLFFHVMAGLVGAGVALDEVRGELHARRGGSARKGGEVGG
ncbi:MAG: phosphoribosyl-ATP diphosphatase [Actinomycetota bacterium]|nr:phosphoribosyl-ATP diphosphatase [Actinomycetota bacterium]